MRYRVWHRTAYAYSAEVEDSVGLFHLVPRDLPWQRVHDHAVTVDPNPGDVSGDVDYFGNSVTYFHLTDPHGTLVIEASSDVTVDPPAYDEQVLAQPWERARPLHHPQTPGAWRATEYALESARAAHVPEATHYAAASLLPGRPLGEAVTDLMRRIHADFAYDSTATTVTSTVADVLRTRAGVCQDFAHLALACLRGHGVAARYVSGYLATQPPPGKERVFGADASHAWLAVWVPGTDEWLAIDPTNDQWADDRYVTVAWGRDYGDVSPVKGIIVTEAKTSTLRVSVDVAPVSA
ncbi:MULTISPECIES: transglutaminase family protein [unclassified Microbacterium]|uniref:transglutaminase family protein n=1 Tax=unclassified Microbacterium TaxID=2609290 RepID=UPI00214B3EFF|nr:MULTISPECIES: transglutaminase family protein [unclassified Microbacterium]MCR2784743.1 transglutaminase family protein [Microbacterium sp. zg.B96]MDL5352802.1 transglutaminase family protein [Microbacterium sp. zg-YB36]WIM16282.1 transglutaminase family protein [Microbacterium sp. zg-B96]